MEIFDIVDEHGEPTGKTVDRATAHREGIRHRTAHVWLLRKKNGRVQILLQKRSLQKASFPGCYDISSAGHIPAGCGYIESALRELEEELGLTAAPSSLVFCGDRYVARDESFFGVPFHDRQYSRVFLLWEDRDEKDFTLQEEELDSVLWMDFEACVKAVRENSFRHCIAEAELDMLARAMEAKGIR